ncbi:type I-E CRISPR-associated protein Cse1/CasA [Candidatus Poribacteria bacterium]|nr:type I-E CRISPR-associated protein Cse1/CasA [Candidatus Poribacteria bacterium]
MNILEDAWIPMRTTSGDRVGRLADLLDPSTLGPNWPKKEWNWATNMLAISAMTAMNPLDEDEEETWQDRIELGSENLNVITEKYADDFNFGEGENWFMTCFQNISGKSKGPVPVERLIFDGPKENTVNKNNDIFFKEGRYSTMPLPTAAIALFHYQQCATGTGRGYRTSLAGAGAVTALVDPGRGYSEFLLANVLPGMPGAPGDWPWKRETDFSGSPVIPANGNSITNEGLFSTPRAVNLIVENNLVVSFHEVACGNNYRGWLSPYSPYRRKKIDDDNWVSSPRLKPGARSYHDWLGVVVKGADNDTYRRPQVVRSFDELDRETNASVIVEGWSVSKATARQYISSRQPLLRLTNDQHSAVRGMIMATERWLWDLRYAFKEIWYLKTPSKLRPKQLPTTANETLTDQFYSSTEAAFRKSLTLIQNDKIDEGVAGFLSSCRSEALAMFEKEFLSSMATREFDRNQEAISKRNFLLGSFNGNTSNGKAAYGFLDLTPVKKRAKSA